MSHWYQLTYPAYLLRDRCGMGVESVKFRGVNDYYYRDVASSVGACESPLYPPASTPGPCFLSHSNGLLNLIYDPRNVMDGVGRGRRCSQSGRLPASARFTSLG